MPRLDPEVLQGVRNIKGVQFAKQVELSLREHNTKIQRTVFNLRSNGVANTQILSTLRTDLNAVSARGKRGGPLFRSMFKDIDSAIEQRVKDGSKTGYQHRANIVTLELNEAGGIEATNNNPVMTWVCSLGSAGKGGPTCRTCIVRHGVERPFSRWVSLGLPASGFSVCDTNCNCTLIPTVAPGPKPKINKPLQLARKELRISAARAERVRVKGGRQRRSTKDEAILKLLGSANNQTEVTRLISAFKERF